MALVGVMTQTITKKRISEMFGVSYNTIQQQFRNGLSNPPEPLGKVGNQFIYDLDLVLQWVNDWQSRDNRKKPEIIVPKLMNLNVKWGKPREIVLKLDNLKKQSYSQ
jgi:hypothetical protein